MSTPQTARLLLVRHGETDWNARGLLQGQADVPLNARGRGQARRMAALLSMEPRLDAIYASDLSRARETADIIAARLGLPVTIDRDLREMDLGSLDGLPKPVVVANWERDFDGEPPEAHAARVKQAVLRIARRHPGCCVLVVTHGGSIKSIQEGLGLIVDGVLDHLDVLAVVCEGDALRLEAPRPEDAPPREPLPT